MRTDHKKITVLMPAYNAGKYIREAIESVLQQTHRDLELLIVNDGSTDDTVLVFFELLLLLDIKENSPKTLVKNAY